MIETEEHYNNKQDMFFKCWVTYTNNAQMKRNWVNAQSRSLLPGALSIRFFRQGVKFTQEQAQKLARRQSRNQD